MSDKPPAFQFYPRDFLTDERVRLMSHTERGIYITLLCLCWLEQSLPSDLNLIAKLVQVPPVRFRKLWTSALGDCFHLIDGRYRNRRLDEERRKQTENRQRRADAAHMRWDKQSTCNADAMQCSSSASSSASATAVSSEALTRSEPPVLTYPVIGKGPKSWDLTQSQIDEWIALYPGMDVLGECRKALAWIMANSKKTAHGMPRFLTSWLNRATDRRGGGQQSGLTKQTIGLAIAGREFLRGGSDGTYED